MTPTDLLNTIAPTVEELRVTVADQQPAVPADVLDDLRTFASAIGAPLQDGFQPSDIPVMLHATMSSLMAVAGVLNAPGETKREWVLDAYDWLVAEYRDQLDIPWVPGWIDDPIEDAMIQAGRDLLEVLYSAAAKRPPLDRILG